MRELSLFQTGAPELVLHWGPLKELDGRYCTTQLYKNQNHEHSSTRRELLLS